MATVQTIGRTVGRTMAGNSGGLSYNTGNATASGSVSIPSEVPVPSPQPGDIGGRYSQGDTTTFTIGVTLESSGTILELNDDSCFAGYGGDEAGLMIGARVFLGNDANIANVDPRCVQRDDPVQLSFEIDAPHPFRFEELDQIEITRTYKVEIYSQNNNKSASKEFDVTFTLGPIEDPHNLNIRGEQSGQDTLHAVVGESVRSRGDFRQFKDVKVDVGDSSKDVGIGGGSTDAEVTGAELVVMQTIERVEPFPKRLQNHGVEVETYLRKSDVEERIAEIVGGLNDDGDVPTPDPTPGDVGKECGPGNECSDGLVCDAGKCVTPGDGDDDDDAIGDSCQDTDGCPGDLVCKNGVCVEPTGGDDGDPPPGGDPPGGLTPMQRNIGIGILALGGAAVVSTQL